MSPIKSLFNVKFTLDFDSIYDKCLLIDQTKAIVTIKN